MKISIVVPAFNEEKLITSCLQSIRQAAAVFQKLGVEFELIVCDNNSTDRTAELARAEGANVVFEPINQIARARNAGANAASGDWLIFIDADSHPTAELFADVVEAIQSGDCLAGGSTLTLDGCYPFGKLITEGWNILSRMRKLVAGSFIFCDRNVFQQMGGFNEKLFASEEIDLSIRLKRLARQQRKRIVILHRHPMVTSARKLHLYSVREHLGFLGKTIVRFGRPLRSREECFTWYDGRR